MKMKKLTTLGALTLFGLFIASCGDDASKGNQPANTNNIAASN